MQNVDFLKNPEVVKQLASILKTNESACRSLGHTYVIQVNIVAFILCTLFFNLEMIGNVL